MNYRCVVCLRNIERPPLCDNQMCLDQARRDAMRDNPRPNPWIPGLPAPVKWDPPKVDGADVWGGRHHKDSSDPAPDTLREFEAAVPEVDRIIQLAQLLEAKALGGCFVSPEDVLMLTDSILGVADVATSEY